ncbi:hypothetical protein Atai01_79520 [Amycolatopsis taiwanensis]|uniref:Uncharacterized protein n=1 Tax=Amycolatopsis taiwanensis TaxID=342230 RepID=A0A9W6VGY6_9PSEU|nr:hypothetical protein Atai01_79520 [Amycolatopsis taiwanensis]
MARYTPAGAARAQELFAERDRLRAQPVATAHEAAIREVEASILRLTGAPTVEAARAGIRGFLKGKQKVKNRSRLRNTKRTKQVPQADVPKQNKKKKKKNKKKAGSAVSRTSSLPRIKVVRGGLPGSGRR